MKEEVLFYIDIVSKLMVTLGFPLAYIQYRRTKRKERRDREYGTYNALDEKYLEFQRLCLNYPHLNIFDIPDDSLPPPTKDQKKEELILFTMLFSIFERAFLLYSDQSSSIKKKQWVGWDSYIKSYCERDNFINAWKISGSTFDTDYEQYMNENIQLVEEDQSILEMNSSV